MDILAIFLALILLAMLTQPFFVEKRKYRYNSKKYIMTRAEADLYRKLLVLYGKNQIIAPQVRLSSLLNEKVKGQNWRAALAHVNQKSVDFVVLDKQNLEIRAVIECDDYTHNKKDRQFRDSEVNRILGDAAIPFYRLKNSLHKDANQIKKDIDKQKQERYT